MDLSPCLETKQNKKIAFSKHEFCSFQLFYVLLNISLTTHSSKTEGWLSWARLKAQKAQDHFSDPGECLVKACRKQQNLTILLCISSPKFLQNQQFGDIPSQNVHFHLSLSIMSCCSLFYQFFFPLYSFVILSSEPPCGNELHH